LRSPGIVIAGFAVGLLFYTLTVSRVPASLGVNGMMITGATLVGLQLAAVGVRSELEIPSASLLVDGLGFYMIHGSLQVFASELSGGSPRHVVVVAIRSSFHGQPWPDRLRVASRISARYRPCLQAAVVMVAGRHSLLEVARPMKPADAVLTFCVPDAAQRAADPAVHCIRDYEWVRLCGAA